MVFSAKEKRRDVRYTVKAPASLTMKDTPSKVCMLFLYNLSSGGALAKATIPIPQYKNIILRTKLPFQQKWFGRDAVEFIFRGKVIRKTRSGKIAIRFDDDFRISTILLE